MLLSVLTVLALLLPYGLAQPIPSATLLPIALTLPLPQPSLLSTVICPNALAVSRALAALVLPLS